MRPTIRLDPWACYFAALLLLTVPLNWLTAALTGALFHELCHILALRLTRGRILGIRVGMGGAAIRTAPLSPAQELICALAGPAGSLFLVLFWRQFPRLAICAGIQGFFNLLPIYPLDGGRVLVCFLSLSGILPHISGKRPCKPGKIRVQ